MEPCTRTEPTILNRGNPAQTGRRLGQDERSPHLTNPIYKELPNGLYTRTPVRPVDIVHIIPVMRISSTENMKQNQNYKFHDLSASRMEAM